MTGVLSATRYRCADCGRDVTGHAWTQPCLCGGTYRVCVASDETVYRMPDRPGLPRFDPFKDWRVKFLQLSWNLSCLENEYDSDLRVAPESVRSTVTLALTCCVDLADWLLAGPELPALTAGNLDRLLRDDPLRVAADFCGRGPGSASVRLAPVAFAPRVRFWVEHSRPGAKPVRYDALDLARRCHEAWRQFLAAHAVALPHWSGPA